MSEQTGQSGEIAQVYEHRIHVNIGGQAKRPVVTLWCSDCIVTVGDFDQSNEWTTLHEAVTEHRSRPSRREELSHKNEEADHG